MQVLDDGVRGLQDGRHRHLFDGDVAGFVHDYSAHGTPWVEGSISIKLVRQWLCLQLIDCDFTEGKGSSPSLPIRKQVH